MSTHVPGLQLFFSFFALYCIGKIVHHQHIRANNKYLKGRCRLHELLLTLISYIFSKIILSQKVITKIGFYIKSQNM